MVSNTSFTPLKGDCSAGIGISSHPQRQGMFKTPYHCTEECLQGVTPLKRYLCAVRSAMTTLMCTPFYGGGLDVRAWYGASLSCGIFFLWCQFVKTGFRMKVHWFMSTKLLLCVTCNLHKFKINIFTPHD